MSPKMTRRFEDLRNISRKAPNNPEALKFAGVNYTPLALPSTALLPHLDADAQQSITDVPTSI